MLRDRVSAQPAGGVRERDASTRERRWLWFRVSVAVLIGALAVGIGVALLLRNTLVLRRSANRTILADQYLLRVVQLEDVVINAETGLRGDVITGRPLFLQPVRQARAQLPEAIHNAEASAAVTGLYRPQLGELVAAVNAYMQNYLPGVLSLTRERPAAARAFTVTLEGKHEVDAVRRLAQALEQQLAQRGAIRQRGARNTANASVEDAIVVLVLLTLATALLGAYLGNLAVSRERARQDSDATARTLQESTLPSALPQIPGCELAVRFVPGEGPISGDFYDCFKVGADTWALLIGDVCGKGAPAAAATAMARWTLRSSLGQGTTPDDALRLLNDVMLAHPQDQRFITALCMTITVGPGVASLQVACAGHPAPLVVSTGQMPQEVRARGDLLGIFPTLRLHTAQVELGPGDALVAYTDGVTDKGPEVTVSPAEALQGSLGSNAEAMASTLERLALTPTAHADDIAIIALRFLGEQDASAPASTTDARRELP
jgi:serine phosphatase RsbU (regulator of sigma subunit)